MQRRGKRQLTEPPESNVAAFNYEPYLEIRFSDILQTKYGVFFGSDLDNDVAILNSYVNQYYFALTFNNVKRFIVKDCGFFGGINVIYNGDKQGKRNGFQWIVSDYSIPYDKLKIIIRLNNSI